MNEGSQQIDSALNICIDQDQPLKGKRLKETFLYFVKNIPGCKIVNESIDKRVIALDLQDGAKHRFCLAAVTFLGGNGNHPIFKKRIQLKEWYKTAYMNLKSQGCTVHFMGIYHYNGNIVFVDFLPDTYVTRKTHNSSAFVYVNDLFRAMQDGIAYRNDFHGNTIVAIRANELSNYISCNASGAPIDNSELIKEFSDFNEILPFNCWLKGGDTINKMRLAQWSKWRETEWPGWYLEFEFCSFLRKNNIKNIFYKGVSSKKEFHWELDFDLFFPKHKFYGDLKASDSNKDEAPGNDKETVAAAISRYGRLWYIIYEHDTVKDCMCNGEVCKIRYELLLADPAGKAKSPDSYIRRMKNRIKFKKMMILELNRANCNKILKDFHQGHQPDGSARAAKVLIRKKDMENFQIFHYPS